MYGSPVNERIGMRALPRLSESQAVGGFREILSDQGVSKGNYRHVSNKDFHTSQEHTMIHSSTNADTKRPLA